MRSIERASTGIKKLDEILGGGLPRGSITLVAGGPGTGKTIFAAQFVYSGAKKFGDRGIFVTFEEKAETIKRYMLTLGWNFDELENLKQIRIMDLMTVGKSETIDLMLSSIIEAVKAFEAKRLVIDSITALTFAFKDKTEIRILVSLLQKFLRKANCTTILTTETPWGDRRLGAGVEEFIADGIILLETIPYRNEFRRRLSIPKMRYTKYSLMYYQYNIVENEGITLTPYPAVM
jgi:circadian clock protein KaiC